MKNKIKSNIGGKATSLYKLKEIGINVPEFLVFSEEDLNTTSVSSIVKKVTNTLQADYYAVRSSANLEDGKINSFAGIFETELFVSPENIAVAIDKVIASKQSEKVAVYLQLNKIDSSKLTLAVIIQKMIAADTSGVAFGVDPLKPYKKSHVISSVYGLGEGLVSGALNADPFVFTQAIWSKNIADKEKKLIYNGAKLEFLDVPDNLRKKETLSENQLNQLSQVLTVLESKFGEPQDVEFCFSNETLFILQSRPITTLKKFKTHIIWDNSNIIESYPGITLPFTFSFILDIYESVYKNFVQLLGVPNKQIVANNDVFTDMLGHVNGRVYYHLIHWYKALAMLPGYTINASYMEKMMGVNESLNISFTLKEQPNKLQSYYYVLKTLVKMIVLNYRLPKIKKNFTIKVNNIIKNAKQKEYSQSTTKQIWADYNTFKSLLVNEWSPPLANDLLAMIYFGTLQKLCTKWLLNEHIHTQLIVGHYPVKSVLPAKLLNEIICMAQNENLLAEIKTTHESLIWKKCKENKLGKTGQLILQYIKLYGDRSVGELKLENETFTQNPEAFISIIKSYKNSVAKFSNKQEKVLIKDIVQKLPFHKKKILSYVAKKAAEYVADRENLRFDRTFGFGTIRMFLWEIGKKMEKNKELNHFKDIFYLEEKEVNALIESKITAEEAKLIIAKRKVTFTQYMNSEILPVRINQWDDELDIEYVTEIETGQMQGIPCCSGEVVGRVKILSDPSEVQSLEGDILVTTSTDPGWITIFQSASALLVERGSTLSHAAIVSREMGIPCIVGIKGITKLLKNGDLIKMNGKTGIVEKLEYEQSVKI